MKPIKLVYITGRGHSGSTLLALLLSGHSQVISAGEVKMLVDPDPQHRLCSCHRLLPEQCPFWGEVQVRIQVELGLPLKALTLTDQGDLTAFALHNNALFAAIASVSDCAIIVDSSKSLPRLSRLLAAQDAGLTPEIEILPIHLHRGPLGLMNSARKLGYDLRECSDNYNRMFFLTRARLASVRSLEVFYERLARNPRREVARVMSWLSLSFEPSQMRWRIGIRHDIHGNPMRFGKSQRLAIDQSWRTELTVAQKLAVSIWTLPVRSRFYWLFRVMRPFISPASFGKWFCSGDSLSP